MVYFLVSGPYIILVGDNRKLQTLNIESIIYYLVKYLTIQLLNSTATR